MAAQNGTGEKKESEWVISRLAFVSPSITVVASHHFPLTGRRLQRCFRLRHQDLLGLAGGSCCGNGTETSIDCWMIPMRRTTYYHPRGRSQLRQNHRSCLHHLGRMNRIVDSEKEEHQSAKYDTAGSFPSMHMFFSPTWFLQVLARSSCDDFFALTL
jgi:hypothetical protein